MNVIGEEAGRRWFAHAWDHGHIEELADRPFEADPLHDIPGDVLDEMSQLYNILASETSFASLRPLLPIDQPTEFSARMLIYPGLTGRAEATAVASLPQPPKQHWPSATSKFFR